jgi:acetylornithine deacetylase
LIDISRETVDRLRNALQPERLLKTATSLVGIPSPTRDGTAVSDCLANILKEDGFAVERPEAGWPKAPAVASRYTVDDSGRTLQFNGHLDTVHLPFVPPRVENGILYGSGASDMKGGIAAMVEAMRILKETELLPTGGILLTAHDLHEAPWGDGSQVDGLIDAGFVGDAVLLPEYLCDQLPILGRGLAVLEVSATREGEPLHEVLGGMEQPNVIQVGSEIVRRFNEWNDGLKDRTHPMGVRESAFVGQISAGEIYNQSPTEFHLSGTRRWLPGTNPDEVRREFAELLSAAEEGTGTQVEGEFHFVRDAFELDPNDWLVDSFQAVCTEVMGEPLPLGVKPFVDDGNTFSSKAGIPAITHGPNAKGAHTVHEEVPVSELERVALVYALTAIVFCDA